MTVVGRAGLERRSATKIGRRLAKRNRGEFDAQFDGRDPPSALEPDVRVGLGWDDH